MESALPVVEPVPQAPEVDDPLPDGPVPELWMCVLCGETDLEPATLCDPVRLA